MNKLIRITGAKNILKLLTDFSDVFPGLVSRISSPAEYAEKLDRFGEVYCGMSGTEAFGMAALYANNTDTCEGYISLIGVKKRYEHMGLGVYMLNESIGIMRKNGMNTVRLEVDDRNRHAREFYKRNGFKECGAASPKSRYMIKSIIEEGVL